MTLVTHSLKLFLQQRYSENIISSSEGMEQSFQPPCRHQEKKPKSTQPSCAKRRPQVTFSSLQPPDFLSWTTKRPASDVQLAMTRSDRFHPRYQNKNRNQTSYWQTYTKFGWSATGLYLLQAAQTHSLQISVYLVPFRQQHEPFLELWQFCYRRPSSPTEPLSRRHKEPHGN